MPKTKAPIQQPSRYDILCGKGKECNGSEGSQRYRLVIDSYRQRYAAASTRHQKCALTLEIYELLAKTSSRFLKYNEKMRAWEELPFMTARDKIGHALRFANRKGPKKGPSDSSVMPHPPAVASAGIQPSPAILAAVSSAPPMYGTLQAIQAQQQAISCATSMQTMTILRSAGLHPTMLQQMPQIQQVQQSTSQGNQIAATNNFMTQVRQLAVQQPLRITSKDCTQQPPQHQGQALQQGGVPQVSQPFKVSDLVSELVSDLPEPKPFKIQGAAQMKVTRQPPAGPDNVLEQAKQHLLQAFNQSTTPNNVQQPQDPASERLEHSMHEARNLTSQILLNTSSVVTTSELLQDTVTTASASKTPLAPGASVVGLGKQAIAEGNISGKVRSSSSVASECEDLLSIMQDSIDTMETIEETCWEGLNDPCSIAGLKTMSA